MKTPLRQRKFKTSCTLSQHGEQRLARLCAITNLTQSYMIELALRELSRLSPKELAVMVTAAGSDPTMPLASWAREERVPHA